MFNRFSGKVTVNRFTSGRERRGRGGEGGEEEGSSINRLYIEMHFRIKWLVFNQLLVCYCQEKRRRKRKKRRWVGGYPHVKVKHFGWLTVQKKTSKTVKITKNNRKNENKLITRKTFNRYVRLTVLKRLTILKRLTVFR